MNYGAMITRRVLSVDTEIAKMWLKDSQPLTRSHEILIDTPPMNNQQAEILSRDTNIKVTSIVVAIHQPDGKH